MNVILGQKVKSRLNQSSSAKNSDVLDDNSDGNIFRIRSGINFQRPQIFRQKLFKLSSDINFVHGFFSFPYTIDSMRSIGFLARSARSRSTVISYLRSRSDSYTPRSVFCFIKAHTASGFAGISFFSGAAFDIGWILPISVATITVCSGVSLTNLIMPWVERNCIISSGTMPLAIWRMHADVHPHSG